MTNLKHPLLRNLSLEDRKNFWAFGLGASKNIPEQFIHQAFEKQAQKHPLLIAATHEGESITYKDLNELSNALASHLLNLGCKPNKNVGLFLERSIPMLVGILGILKIGAAYVPQDARISPLNQLNHIINTSDIDVVLTLSHLKYRIPISKGLLVIALDDLIKKIEPKKNNLKLQKNLTWQKTNSFILYTSGTTGLPNGVKVTHRNICNLLLTEPGNLNVQAGEKVSQILNISFDMAAWEIFLALINGATLVIRGKSIPSTISKVDTAIATPSILANLDHQDNYQLKTIAVAGEPCSLNIAQKWARHAVFFNACGPTETTIVNTMQLVQKNINERVTIGSPTPNNAVYILDKKMIPCAIGEVGEMWAGGSCVTQGYVKNQKLTKERYFPDPFLGDDKKMFRTRDLGRWNRKGELEHLGRTDDQVRVKGFRVELDSISTTLESLKGVLQAVTIKLDNRTLVSFVSPEETDCLKIKKNLQEKLPYYSVPSLIIPLKRFPKTERGKVDKRELELLVCKFQEAQEVDQLQEELPKKKEGLYGLLRRPFFRPYNRLIIFVILINFFVFSKLSFNFSLVSHGISPLLMLYLTLGNFGLGIFIRQQQVINFLFKVAISAPKNLPLSLRWALGKVYHFGGVHVGSFFSGTVWYSLFLGTVVFLPVQNFFVPDIVKIVGGFHVVLLFLMMFVSLPKFRQTKHNFFEVIARFGNWASLLLFWFQSVRLILANSQNMGVLSDISQAPELWILSYLTFCVALPWFRLKKIPVEIKTPSSHVGISEFNYGVTPFAGSSTDLSLNPLFEWHSFANIPCPHKPGFRLCISNAGDWTKDYIKKKPKHIWVKGIPVAGVGNIEQLFKKVVWVATGSGVGPCLPHLLDQKVPSTMIWSTKSPRETYGNELVDEILKAQPNTTIWDTKKLGRPNLVELSLKAYKDFDAEAVIVISNKKLTFHVNYELESRGIPCFGAIWDS